MNKTLSPLPFFAVFAAATLVSSADALAESQWRVPVHFAITNDAGVGYSWFVVGSHLDLGNWDVLRAAPLAWHEGNVWSADVGVRAGADLPSTDTTGYKFVKRPTNAAEYPDANNTEWVAGANLSLAVPAEPDAPHGGKRVVFLCPWDEPVWFHWSRLSRPNDYGSTNEWEHAQMAKTGEGRYEGLFGGPELAGEWIRFTVSGYENGVEKYYHFYGTEETDKPEDFYAPLDAFCIRDGQVFDYEPVPTAAGWVSDSKIISTNVYSTADRIDGREIRIYLPRGYDENTSRRYPVVYFSDGQNVFQPGGQYGCWNAETAADREIRGGRMREAILVAVPCRTDDIPGRPGTSEFARLWEYLPSTDTLMTTDLRGLGANYADFLIHNVKPTLDYNFRTLSDRENTAHIGSSAGGLLSLYLGTAYGDVFGLVAPMSGVYNEEYIPKFRQWCLEHPDAVAKPKRVWLDTGTEETAIGEDEMTLNLYESNWDALTLLLYAGHVPNKSLRFGVYTGWQGEHNEPAWADRLADVYDFLLPVTDEFNPLLPRELGLNGDTITFPIYPASSDSIVHLSSLLPPATTNTIPIDDTTDHPWSVGTFAPADAGFYFLKSTP